MRGFFVCGTDTGVGKTIASAIFLHLALERFDKVSYHKPIQTGPDLDAETIAKLLPSSACAITTGISLEKPLSPHLAAHYQNIVIDLPSVVKKTRFYCSDTFAILEGAGGLLVPINKTCLMVDLIAQLDIPCILVARTTLGTINHTLLSIEALKTRKIPILGILMMGPKNPDNKESIKFYSGIKNIISLTYLSSLNPQALAKFAHIHKNELAHFFNKED